MRGIPPDTNPRDVLPHHRERGDARYSYSTGDLAELFGVSKKTIHNWSSAGKLDPSDIRSVGRLLVERAQTRKRGTM